MGLPELVIGGIAVIMIVIITAIAQPPNKWVEWFGGRKRRR
jgi:hypothetical protein